MWNNEYEVKSLKSETNSNESHIESKELDSSKDTSETSHPSEKKDEIKKAERHKLSESEFVSDTFQTTETDLEEVKAGMRKLGINSLAQQAAVDNGKTIILICFLFETTKCTYYNDNVIICNDNLHLLIVKFHSIVFEQ